MHHRMLKKDTAAYVYLGIPMNTFLEGLVPLVVKKG